MLDGAGQLVAVSWIPMSIWLALVLLSSYSLNMIISYLFSLLFGLVEAGKSQPGFGVTLT
jgi:hypothetical protein